MKKLDLKQLQVEWNQLGKPAKIRGEIELPKEKTVELSISEFLKSNASELRLNIDTASLRVVHKADTPIGEFIRYQQFIGEIPVFNSFVIVQAQKGKIKELHFGHVDEVKIIGDSKAKTLTSQAVYEMALKSLGNVDLRGDKIEPSLVYYSSREGLMLTYLIFILTQNPMHDWRIIADAVSGQTINKEDIIKSMPDGSGYVFDPNPVVTANDNTLRQPTATVAAGCGYAGSSLTTIDAQRVIRTLKDLTLSGGVYSLDGPYAKIVDIYSPTSSIPTETIATAFTYSSSDEKFGAVNCYYHIDTIQRYIQSLGITTANNRQTQCDPVVSGWSAYYSPVNKSLHMGTYRPCRPDKSQEADAIIHEYGHAIQDNQVPGWGGTNPVTGRDESGAMGEGFGDILACVYFATFGGGYQREVFEDWAYSYNGSSALRRVDGTKVYPTNWGYEVHSDGEIWSAALWNIYRAIGGDSLALLYRIAARDALLKTVITSHNLLATTASMPDGAEAIMNTNAQLDEYRGKHLMEILKSFHDRGILKCNSSADLFIRDDTSDTGGEPFSGPVFWESPDLWVRNFDDDVTAYQDPEHGQDNYFYARVKNRGTATARAFVVTFNVKPWAGTQFVYPNDFVPFISAACGFNLAPGASTIVKAKWPASMLPPTGTHACLLAQVYMPTDTSPAGSHVWDKNNLAQKNMTIVDAIPGDMVMAWFNIGNIHELQTDLYNIELVRPAGRYDIRASIVGINAFETKKLFHSGLEWHPAKPVSSSFVKPALMFKDHSTIELSGSGLPTSLLRLNFAPGSSIDLSHFSSEETKYVEFERNARLIETSNLDTEIELNTGKTAGLPVLIQAGTMVKCALKLVVPKNAEPGETLKFQILQRNTKGKILGGITVLVNVVKNKK